MDWTASAVISSICLLVKGMGAGKVKLKVKLEG